MVRIKENTVIEIWSEKYINNVEDRRFGEDKDAKIIQIEHGNGNDYIVEVERKCDVVESEEQNNSIQMGFVTEE